MMLVALLLLTAAPGQLAPCGLMRPVAPNEAAARRIAAAVLRNVPTQRLVNIGPGTGRPYQLVVQADRNEPLTWSVFQVPPRTSRSIRGGGGLAFRIDRCTGAISRMHYSR
jgi:hypothetical protein